MATPGSVSLSTSNILADGNIVLAAGQYFRSPADAVLANDMVRLGQLQTYGLVQINNQRALTTDLDLRSGGYEVFCNTPTRLYSAATKQYVDTSISSYGVGTTI